jgi:peptidoglycan/xylan/chitin deacetylase (PgdA/CDA1 family)
MRILMYHGVGDDALAADVFEAHLGYLRAHHEVVSLYEVLRRLEEPDRITGREVALTFDDGLANNATVAAPLLAQCGLPATFFVCPALIDEGRWLWNHELRARLAAMDAEARATLAARFDLVGDVVEAAKVRSEIDRRAVETAVREATPAWAPSAAERLRSEVMTWAQLRKLDGDLIAIGSHTLSHPILPTLDDDTLAREVEESAQRLSSELDRPVDLFCYPNGAEDARVRAAARRTYRAAVTTESGVVEAGADLHALPRVSCPPYPSRPATLSWRLYRP